MEKFDFIDSKFRLSILAAKRAKQLVGGSKKRVDTDAENPLTIALEEIYDGKVHFQILEKEIIDGENESLGVNFEENEDDSSFRLDEDNPEELLYNEDEEDEDKEESEEENNQEKAG